MFTLDLKKAEEPEIKLPKYAGSPKKQEFQKNIYFCFIDYAKACNHVNHNKLENSERDGNTKPPYLPPEIRTGYGTTDWFQIRKGVCQGCILSPCLFNFYAEYIMRKPGLEEAQAGIKIAGEKSITSDMQMSPPLWQKAKKNKELLDESERRE